MRLVPPRPNCCVLKQEVLLMKRFFRRLGLCTRIREQRGSVLMFAVVMMFLMISFVNILVSSVASRSYFSRKVTTLNEYVNLSENTSTLTVKELRSFMRENVILVQHYFAQGYFSSATTGFNSGKTTNEKIQDQMLSRLLSTSQGQSYHKLMQNFYNTEVKGSFDKYKTADHGYLKEKYVQAARCLFAYLTAARLRYDNTATDKKDANYSIFDKYTYFLTQANDGYTQKRADGTQETIPGLKNDYFKSQILSSGFKGDFGTIYKVLPAKEIAASNIPTLSASLGKNGGVIGTVSFATYTEGLTPVRKTELGFNAYYQQLSADILMPDFTIKGDLVQRTNDYYAVVTVTDFSSESWVQQKVWARYPTNDVFTPLTF